MKVKTSITLSEYLIKELDNLVAEYGNRSKIIEIALNEFFTHKRRELRDNNDLELINSNIDDLNKEAEDTISYQVKI